jgi:predicted Zn-dependent peptidase
MYDVVAELIAGELGSHLRQELGASYGVEGHAYSRAGGSAYMILKTAIGNDELRFTIAALRGIWDELRDGELNLQDLSAEKMARVRYRTFRFEHSDDLADELLTEWLMKWPLTTIDDYASYVVAVRGADARALLRGCAKHLAVTIAGDPDAIAGALAP